MQSCAPSVRRYLSGGKDLPLDRLPNASRFALFDLLNLVEAAKEQEVGNLFDDLERVGNPASPEGVPDPVNLAANLASEHARRGALQDTGDPGRSTGDVPLFSALPSAGDLNSQSELQRVRIALRDSP